MEKDKRTERKYSRVGRILKKKYTALEDADATGDPEKIAVAKNKLEKADKKYGYNYEGAKQAGIEPDETGHWASRNPNTGEILKGKRHPTIDKTKKAERGLGYKIKRIGGKLYSFPK